jgi:hypothetical protein
MRLYFSLLFSPLFPCTTPFKTDLRDRVFLPTWIVRSEAFLYQKRIGQVPTGSQNRAGIPVQRGEQKTNRAEMGTAPTGAIGLLGIALRKEP